MKRQNSIVMTAGLVGLLVAGAGRSWATPGFGSSQSLDAKEFLAEAGTGKVLEDPSAKPVESKTYAVGRLEPYLKVHCGQGAATSAEAIDGRVFLDVKVPALAMGVERFALKRSEVTFSIDKSLDFHIETQGGFWSSPSKVRVGKLQLQDSCMPHHVNRDIETYVPALPAADVSAELAVKLDGACWSSSNWPNGPGRSYFRPILIDLTISQAGGATLKLSKKETAGYLDEESCEKGAR